MPCRSACAVAFSWISRRSFRSSGLFLLSFSRSCPLMLSREVFGVSCHWLLGAGSSICRSASSSGRTFMAAFKVESPATSRRRIAASLRSFRNCLRGFSKVCYLVVTKYHSITHPFVMINSPRVLKPALASWASRLALSPETGMSGVVVCGPPFTPSCVVFQINSCKDWS